MKFKKYSLSLLAIAFLAGAASAKLAAQTIIADGSSVALESAVDAWGDLPSFASTGLRLTFVRPQASGLELLPIGSYPGLYALFTNGTRRAILRLPTTVYPSLPYLTPWSPDLSSTFELQWGDARLPGGANQYAFVALPDERAPATLDYAGTFRGDDPHEAATIGPRFDQRDESSLAEFRRLAGLPADFAPWTVLTNFAPKFFVAQADGLIVASPSPADNRFYFFPDYTLPPPRRYRRDGTEDTSFTPPAGININVSGQLPDGRFLGTVERDGSESNLPIRPIAFAGTNITQAELLAFMGPWIHPGLAGALHVVQFAIINQDGSMILDQGVRPRGCGKLDNREIIGLPSLNGERLRGTRARLFWKAPAPTRFAFRQLRRSRAVRESADKVIVEVRRLGDLSKNQFVLASTADVSAKAGHNYEATSAALIFPPGQVSRSIRVPILQAGLGRGSLDFSMELLPGGPDSNTSAEMIATPRHTVTIQGSVRLEWPTPNRVRVWNPPYQFTVRAFGSLAEAATSQPARTDSLDFGKAFGLSANQYAPATDYFDLDLTALPTLGGFPGWQPFNAVRERFFSEAGGHAVFLRVEGTDDDTEETDDYCP